MPCSGGRSKVSQVRGQSNQDLGSFKRSVLMPGQHSASRCSKDQGRTDSREAEENVNWVSV